MLGLDVSEDCLNDVLFDRGSVEGASDIPDRAQVVSERSPASLGGLTRCQLECGRCGVQATLTRNSNWDVASIETRRLSGNGLSNCARL